MFEPAKICRLECVDARPLNRKKSSGSNRLLRDTRTRKFTSVNRQIYVGEPEEICRFHKNTSYTGRFRTPAEAMVCGIPNAAHPSRLLLVLGSVASHPRTHTRRGSSPAPAAWGQTRASCPSRRELVRELRPKTSEPACLAPLPFHPRHILKPSRQARGRAAGFDPACPAPEGMKACPAPSDAILSSLHDRARQRVPLSATSRRDYAARDFTPCRSPQGGAVSE